MSPFRCRSTLVADDLFHYKLHMVEGGRVGTSSAATSGEKLLQLLLGEGTSARRRAELSLANPYDLARVVRRIKEFLMAPTNDIDRHPLTRGRGRRPWGFSDGRRGNKISVDALAARGLIVIRDDGYSPEAALAEKTT